MSDEETVAQSPSGAWKDDNEAALVRRHNESHPSSTAALVFGGELEKSLGRTSDPTDDPNVDTSISTEVAEDVVRAPEPAPVGCVAGLLEWWAQRKLEQNKEHGMDPYVVVKMGRHGREARTQSFLSREGDPPELYTNPKWTEEHSHMLTVERTAKDRGELIVEVYDEGLEKDRFIGSCHVHLAEFIQHADTTENWKHTMFHLYDQQDLADTDDDQRDAGGIHALVRWVPEVEDGNWVLGSNGLAKGVLRVKVLAGTDLRDVSTVRISDITSFADTGSSLLTFYLMFSFIVAFSFFYRYVVWANVKQTDDSTLFTDSVLFVLTTFTTVGYGDHPQLLETKFERLITVVFIILGMGILGVTIGTWGDMIKVKLDQKKRRARERLLKKMRDSGIDTSNISGSDDIKEQVMKKLRAQYPEEKDIDEHLIQTETGKALITRFWKDELKKLLFGLIGLVAILALGTAVFLYTEQLECFVSDLSEALADPDCKVRQYDAKTGQPNDGLEGRPRSGDLITPGKTERGLRVIDALYFTTVTASTVGYGDVTPQSWPGKVFACFYIPIAVALMSKTIMSIALIPMEYRQLKLEAYVLDQFGDELSAPDFADLKASVNIAGEEPIRKNDFTLAMLLRLGRIGKYDITRIEQIFARLDKDNTGVLDKDDVLDLLAVQKMRIEQSRKMLGVTSDADVFDESAEAANAGRAAGAAAEGAAAADGTVAETENPVAEDNDEDEVSEM